jgi:hypothetical protein
MGVLKSAGETREVVTRKEKHLRVNVSVMLGGLPPAHVMFQAGGSAKTRSCSRTTPSSKHHVYRTSEQRQSSCL